VNDEEELPFMGMWGSRDLRSLSKRELINALVTTYMTMDVQHRQHEQAMNFLEECA